MDRRRFLLTSLAGALPSPLTTAAQPARNVPRVGFLTWGACPGPVLSTRATRLVGGSTLASYRLTVDPRCERERSNSKSR